MSRHLTIRIDDRRPFADGHDFGGTGPYERLSGRVLFAVDPDAPAQADVVDIDKAPRDEDGRVRFEADFMILKPAHGNGRVLFDYGNRGHKRALQFFNDAPHSNDPLSRAHAGNGFLMRRGYAVAWLAWEGDIMPGDGRVVLDVPVATDNGAPITGRVRTEIIVDAPGTTTLPLSGRVAAWSYPVADPSDAVLTRRRFPYDPKEVVPRSAWCFGQRIAGSGAESAGTESALVPSDRFIHYPAGFQPGWIYELLYTARDPKLMGLGHVAVRDFVSFLKHEDSDANPLAGVQKVYGWGRSQTGRCLRDFVYRGYNADAAGRRVFDGVMPHVAGAGRKWLNHRFASPIVSGGQQYEDHFNIADSFPFSYAWSRDHLTGREDAILKRPQTDPLVFHTQTASEYWTRRGSLVHTDTQGNDLPQPDTVRVYFWSSSQHSANPLLAAPVRGVGQNLSNSVATSMLFRAMLDAMDRWATDGTPPPPSRIPTRADGTLVEYARWKRQFPAIPGVMPLAEPNALPLLDFGPDAERGLLREPPELVRGRNDPDGAPRPAHQGPAHQGPAHQGPAHQGPAYQGLRYTVLVPSVDTDGNDVAGVRVPMVEAPLGTYTGWNPRARGFGHGVQWRFEGSYIPFPDTEAERALTGDPRRPIQARYADWHAYQAAIAQAAERLVGWGLMLDEDIARCVEAAADWNRSRHVTSL
ncbi:alpha/beta hydrolase domain-containing protein [Rhodopila sp.]|uniref:alpha/beta hydrolase domain-containing protein n=1 Tax=Rhodopila sp. TaxID=2480087 RepID=UPI002D155425|nr:alpha/beta hydrolase domain-containing protein [Rhodopila sp.]HVZ07584.1 alpha/beta hydrolase domain-containing protein [Rhodopila sp.]